MALCRPPVVYLAGSPAAALLEGCVHTSANDVPPEFTLLKIEGPDASIIVVEPEDLPDDWRVRPDVTREAGTAWLRKKESVLLRIPSAIIPETTNFLFNPIQVDAARFHIRDFFSYPFDVRLKA
jgi:RES domain-containing protein